MNYIKIAVAGMMLASAFSIQAQLTAHEFMTKTTEQVGKQHSREVDSHSKTYGGYVLQSTLVALPQSLANQSVKSEKLGNLALVATAKKSEAVNEFRKNAVVQNSITEELGVVTGNLTILLKDGVSIQQLEQQFDFSIIKSAEEIGFFIVQPDKEQNLIPIQEQMQSSGLTKVVRLDILEKKYKNQ